MDITAGGETKQDIYFYQANQFAWQKNGMERNPWDSAVQFKDELIRKTFPRRQRLHGELQVHASKSAVPKDLAIVIERPDLYTITCNGQHGESQTQRLVAGQGLWPDRHRLRRPDRRERRHHQGFARSRCSTNWSRPTCWATSR